MNSPVGTKHDTKKTRFSLLPWRALSAVVEVMEWAIDTNARGEKAYVEGNWQYVEDAERRYADAANRHLVAIHQGEARDPESGLLHWAHLSCCALMGTWHATKKKMTAFVKCPHRGRTIGECEDCGAIRRLGGEWEERK